MADNQYKIELGVQLKDGDIQSQINDAQRTLKPIEIKVDAETKELTSTIKEALNSLSKGTKNAFTLDTSSIEKSLDRLSDTITDIKTSLGTLDSKSGMNDLLSSINQITKALGKAENESDTLVKSLNTLSKKDLSVNFGLNMGKSASQVASEQGDIKRNAINQLKQQAKALEDYLDQYYKVAQRGEGVVKLTQGTNVFSSFWELSPNIGNTKVSLKQQVDTYKQYINLMKEAAKIKGIDLSGIFSGFSKSTDDIVKETNSATNGVEQLTQAFKGLFGGGIDAEGLSASLDPITKDLNEIREAVINLSKGVSLNGLTQSFDRLSDSIEKLVSNVTLVKSALGNELGGTTSSINIDDVIDEQAMRLMNEYAITGTKAFDEIRQSLVDFRDGSGDINKVTSAISNNMKVVNEAKNDYKELAEYIKMFNASGAKVHIPDSIKQEYGDDYKSMRSQLGKGFTSGQGMDFETFIEETNEILGQTIDLSHGAEAAFGDLVDKVNSTKGGKFLTGDDLFKNGILDMGDVVANVSTSLEQIENAEEEIARTSTSVSNTVVHNEERKQQAYRETQRLISDSAQKSIDNVSSKSIDESFKIDEASSAKFRREMENLVSQWTDAKGKLTDIKIDTTTVYDKDTERNIEKLRQAQVTYNNELGETIKKTIAWRQIGTEVNTVDGKEISTPIHGFVEVAGQYSKTLGKTKVQTDTFVKQQKQAVSNLTNQINQMNRAANDQNAARPIKDSSHLDTLSSKYREIISAIQRLGSASTDTFVDEQNNVKKLISEYKSLVSEYKNAENVSTKMKGTDFGSGLDIAKNDLEKFKAEAKDFPQITNSVKELDRAIEGVGDAASLNKFNDQLRVARSELAKIKSETSAANRNEKVGINVSGLESKIADLQRISPEIDKFETEIDGAKVSVQSLLNNLKQVKTQGDFSVVNSKWKAFTDAAKSAGIAITETAQKAKSIESIKIKLSDTGFNGFEQEVQRAHLEAEKLEGSTIDLEAALRRLDVAMAGVYSADQANDTKRLVAANEEYENALKKVYSQLKLNQQAEKDTFNAEMLQQRKTSLSSDMEIWLKENTRATKDFGEEIRRLQASLDGLDDRGVKLAGQQFKNLTKQAQVMGKTGLTVFDKLKAKAKEYAAYLSAAEIFMYAEQAFREIFNTVKEIDTAMTGLYRVTDLTAAEYDTLFDNMINSAKEYGATLNDIINATTDWVRAGFDANTSLGLAEVTTMYQHISDLDYDTAAENLITAYNGFKDELNGAFAGDQVAAVEYIADIFNELDNNFAVTSAGLGEALTRSASALDLAGNSIQETAGMVTGIVEVTQDPEKAGSALKVLSLRLRGMKGQLEDLGEETDENVENISKMQGQILNMTSGKVNIFDGAGEFKSTYEIMKGIADVWDELSSIDQANLLETIAGKNRANDVAALLSNWENVEAAVKSASEAEGSAARENAKYVDSIQGRLDKMTTSWQSFANTFMSSDFLKGAISALTSFIEGLEKVIDTVGAFPTLMGTIAAGMSAFKNKGFFSVLNKDIVGAQKQLSLFEKSFNDIFEDLRSGQGFKSFFNKSITKADVSNIQAYNNLIDQCVGSQTAYYRTMQNSSAAAKDLVAGANGGKVALSKLKTATIGGKAALFGLEVAATAANMALTMGLSFAIQLVVEGIMKLVNADKELAESVEEITSKYKEQSESLKKLKSDYDTDNETSMINKYAKLSKGVDNLGRNVSLTADEYSEYQSIVNSIAEQIPSLVSGYDSQGNAILSCKGNVEALTEAYEKLVHTQNQEILTNTNNIEKDFANKVKDANGETLWGKFREWNTNLPSWAKFLVNLSGVGSVATGVESIADLTSGNKMTSDTAKRLKDLLNADRSKVDDIIASYDEQTMSEIETALKDADVDVGFMGKNTAKALEETLKNDSAKIKGIVDNFYSDLEETIVSQKTIAQAKLSEAFDISSVISGLNYGDISEELQAIAYQTVNSFDYDFLSKLSESGKSVEQWTTELLNQLNAISKKDNTQIEAAFDLQTQFNGGEISYGEYVKNLKDVQSTIDGLNLKGEAKEQLEISLGLDENGVIDQYNTLVKRLTDTENYDFNISESNARRLLDGLSAEELSIAVDVIADMSNNDYAETANEIRTAIERELSKQGLSLDLSIETEKTKLEAVATAITESFSGSGLSEESIGAIRGIFGGLSGYDPSKLFERTANGIRLNSEEYRRLNSEYKKINTANVNKEMSTLGDIYNQTREELYRLTYGTEEYNDKARDLDDIEQQIKDLEQLAAGYEGLASAFQEWQMVESAGSQRDMYESILEGFENIDDEISRGWYDDGTIEFLELLTGKDLSTAGIDKVKEAYKGLKQEIGDTGYTVRDFFTVNEDGDSTNTGVYNFLRAVDKSFAGKDVIKRDNKTNKIIGFDFQVVGGDEVIAETLGISEELVQIMVHAADDAGFVVTLDGSFEQLDILKEKAQEAAESLNRILEKNGKKGFDFNFNTSDVDDIKKQLTEAQKILDTFRNTDGAINTELKGADEALTVASTLQSMLDKLTRPTYMDIEVNQVEDELQEPLRNLQELRRLTETEHQLKLSGGDTTQLTADIEELYTELEGLPDETKVEIGLVDDKKQPLTGDALKKKINDIVSGDAELGITATVDIQLEMDEKLGILVDKALLDAGLISDKEFKKRVDIYLDANVDNENAKNDTEQAVNEVVGGKGDSSSGGNKEIKSQTYEIPIDAEVKTGEVKTEGFWDKVKSWWKGLWSKDETETAEVETDVSVEAGEIDTTEVQEEVSKTIEELELTVDEYKDLIQNIEDKDITLSVKVEGLDDVRELNKNIDLATNIEGDIDNLSEFVKGAKSLSELDDNISTFVTAEVKGNVVDEFEYKLNNLKVFSDSAKDLDDIGFINSEVTANVKGNVIDEFEYKINNLKVFSDSAKDLGEIGNVESNVEANVKGNVTDEFEYKLNNLKVFTDNAKDIGSIGNVESNVKATVNTGEDGDVVDTFEYKLNNLSKFAEGVKSLQGLDDVDISVKATVNTGEDGDVVDEFEYKLDNLGEFASHVKDLQGLQSVDIEVKATVNTGDDGDVVDTFEYKLDNLGEFATHVKELQGLESVNISVTAEVNTGESGDVIDTFEHKLNNLETFADGVKALQGVEDVSVTVSAKVDTGNDGDAIDEFEYKLNNLETFAKGAKELQGLENVDISVNAKVNTGDSGDAVDTFEYKLDNLEVFAKAVRELQGLEDVDLSVKATVNGGESGDVTDTFEYKLDNLGEFATHVKSLQGLENVDISVKATVSGDVTETAEYKLDNLGEFKKHAAALQNVESKKISITANIYGNVPEKTEGYLDDLQVFAKGAKALQNTASKTVEITANIYGNVPTYNEGYLDDLQVFAKGANALQSTASKTVNIEANANGNVISGEGASGRISRLTEFKSLVNGMSNKTVTVSVKASVDSENVNKAITLLKDVGNSGVFKNYSATVQVGAKISTLDDTVVKNYKVPAKNGKVSYSVDPASKVYTWTAPPKDGVVNYSAKVDALTDSQKHKTGTITYKAKIEGGSPAAGTAHANGTASGHAFARGNWGIKGNGVALGGELGTEVVVRDGKWFTIGDQGAEFFRYKKNDIVFNATQTAALFKYGGIKGANPRGKMLASGTAYAEGTAFSSGSGGDTEVVIGKNSVTGEVYTKSKESDNFKETINWIETAIERIEREINNLDRTANNTYKTWSKRNKALKEQINTVGEEIVLQQKAYQKYMAAAAGVGLEQKYVDLIKKGAINISTITDEDIAEKVKSYQDYYEKALDAKDAIEELREEESKLYAQRFEYVQSEYENLLQGFDHTESMLNEYINQAEEQGYIVSKNYYTSLIDNEANRIKVLKQEQAALIKARDEAVANNEFDKYSEDWYSMCQEIDGVTQAIEAANTATLEWKNNIRDIDWEIFDLIQQRITDITDEADFLIELMSNKDLFDDKGKFTAQGVSTLGLYAQNYNTLMYQADLAGKEAAKLQRQLAETPYDTTNLEEQYRKRIAEQREFILAAEDAKNAIRDLVEEGINLELDSLGELIDKYQEALDSQKDLYNYQKRVKEQTTEISNLQKQLTSLQGDDSEESRKRIQELRVSLEEAEDDLAETEFEHYIDQQEQLLTSLFDEYELMLNERIDNTDDLVRQVIDGVNATAGALGVDGTITSALGEGGAIVTALANSGVSIKETLEKESNAVGVTLSNAMNSIWDTGDGNAKSVLTMYGDGFVSKATTINDTLNGIKTGVDNVIAALNKDAQGKVQQPETKPSSVVNPTGNKPATQTPAATPNSGKPALTEDKLKGIAAAIWVYGSRAGWEDDPTRKNKLTNKLGATNAKKVQKYINDLSASGKLTSYWYNNKLKLADYSYSAFKLGAKKINESQLAWTQEKGQEYIIRPSDGAILTPVAKGDSVLTAQASNNIWQMANSPAEFIKDNLNLSAANVPNNSNVQNSYIQNLDKVVFSFPNVKNYDEMLAAVQKDKNFERLVTALTIGKLTGGSSLAKGKAIR